MDSKPIEVKAIGVRVSIGYRIAGPVGGNMVYTGLGCMLFSIHYYMHGIRGHWSGNPCVQYCNIHTQGTYDTNVPSGKLYYTIVN